MKPSGIAPVVTIIMRIDIDGKSFENLDTFFSIIEMKLTQDPDYPISRDFNGFEDMLMGGLGVHDYEEPLKIVWINSEKSKTDLGYDATMEYYEGLLQHAHPTQEKEINKDLLKARNKKGPTLFDTVCDIIISMDHVELLLR